MKRGPQSEGILRASFLLLRIPSERAPEHRVRAAVKAVHSGELTEKKALALLYKLEQLTVELVSLNKEIIRLTKEFEQWLQR